ncbi:hypothetical protein RND81_05G046400 [Saponaria officinalis]|uniref:Purple acid phosphatase n=1 Tax=Saponaria officinalis TaxID=3572 RepID=A0AAW1KTQ1_SAPOF
MRITWLTKKPAPSKVEYGTSPGVYTSTVEGTTMRYGFTIFYKSGYIHRVVIGPLKPNTVYYYRCSGDRSREFSLKTTPAQLPIQFVLAADIGRSETSHKTLDYISKSSYNILLLPGDLSYANSDQKYWDSFGRMVEPLASQRPWMVIEGEEDIDDSDFHKTMFTAYNSRWMMPYEESGSSSNMYYSFNVANAVHVIMLGSYSDHNPGSNQYTWLERDLKKVDRKTTPWIVVLFHEPWYSYGIPNRLKYQQMRMDIEHLLYDVRVDIVFSAHVHSYQRYTRVYDWEANKCGLVYITVGSAGNHGDLYSVDTDYTDGRNFIYRESSFGHGQFNVMNSTHAQWIWL